MYDQNVWIFKIKKDIYNRVRMCVWLGGLCIKIWIFWSNNHHRYNGSDKNNAPHPDVNHHNTSMIIAGVNPILIH